MGRHILRLLKPPDCRFQVFPHGNGNEKTHADEACAQAICLLHGTEGWWKKYVEADGRVYVGGGGGPFDEHRNGSVVSDDTCAALLVAESLGIESDPCWRPILKLVCERDRQAVDRCFCSVGKAINLANDIWPDQALVTMNWASIGFQSLYLHDIDGSRADDSELSLLFGRTLDIVGRNINNYKLIHEVMKKMVSRRDYLSIWNMAKAMVPFYQMIDIAEWLARGVESLALDRFIRDDANAKAKALAPTVQEVRGYGGFGTRYVVVRSDNRHISAAFRYLGVPITIQFNDRGNPIVRYDTRADLNLGFVAAKLRAATLNKIGGRLIPPQKVLMRVGDHDGWYYYRSETGGQFVAWETLTHPADEPCSLTPREVEQAVVDGLRLALDDKKERWVASEQEQEQKKVKVG